MAMMERELLHRWEFVVRIVVVISAEVLSLCRAYGLSTRIKMYLFSQRYELRCEVIDIPLR